MKEFFINHFHIEEFGISKMELEVAAELNKAGFDFEQQVSFYDGKSNFGRHFVYDFIIPSRRLLIEYDGNLFHQGAEEKRRDLIKDNLAVKLGYKLLRINKGNWRIIKRDIKKYIFKINIPASKHLKRKPFEYCPESMKKKPQKEIRFKNIKVTIDDYNSVSNDRQLPKDQRLPTQ